MILGITGMSGSGKHTAAQFFTQRGWVILDADKIAHKLYKPYTHVWKAIVERFSEDILNQDDVINRQKLGEIIFNEKDPKASEKSRLDLNQIVHPAIKRYIKDKIHHHFRRKSNVVVVAALWREISLPQISDKILLITSDPRLAMDRIKARDGISEEKYQLRIKGQSDPADPDFLIENNGTIKEFYQALAKLKF